jgi:hypothetical protein
MDGHDFDAPPTEDIMRDINAIPCPQCPDGTCDLDRAPEGFRQARMEGRDD